MNIKQMNKSETTKKKWEDQMQTRSGAATPGAFCRGNRWSTGRASPQMWLKASSGPPPWQALRSCVKRASAARGARGSPRRYAARRLYLGNKLGGHLGKTRGSTGMGTQTGSTGGGLPRGARTPERGSFGISYRNGRSGLGMDPGMAPGHTATTGALRAGTAFAQHSHFAGTTWVRHWCCTGTSVLLHWHYSSTAHVLRWHCDCAVLVLN